MEYNLDDEIKKTLVTRNKMGYYPWIRKLDIDDIQFRWIMNLILDDDFRFLSQFFPKNIIECNSYQELHSMVNNSKIKRNYERLLSKVRCEGLESQWSSYNWSMVLNGEPNNTIKKLSELYEKIEKREDKSIFFRSSTYKSPDDLIRGMNNFINCVDNEYEKILKSIRNNRRIDIIYSNESSGVILARVYSSEDICDVACDTNWCIKYNNHFSSYIKEENALITRKQYILFRTLNIVKYADRKIGITTRNMDGNNSIIYSFDKRNDPCSDRIYKYIINELPSNVRELFGFNIVKNKEELVEIVDRHLKTISFVYRWLEPFSDEFLERLCKGVINSRNRDLLEYIKSDEFKIYLESKFKYRPWAPKIDMGNLRKFVSEQYPESYTWFYS